MTESARLTDHQWQRQRQLGLVVVGSDDPVNLRVASAADCEQIHVGLATNIVIPEVVNLLCRTDPALFTESVAIEELPAAPAPDNADQIAAVFSGTDFGFDHVAYLSGDVIGVGSPERFIAARIIQ